MGWGAALTFQMGLLFALMAIGLPVAFAFFGVNVVGAYFFMGGEAGLVQFTRNAATAVSSFTLTPIPFFLLMGEILFHTGVAFRAIDAIDRLISRVPGRLSLVSIVGGTIFASLSGSTVANTAMLGSVLLPEMLKRGYHPTIAMGPIMAVGGIAMLIPPSALAVLLGSLANISISKLLIAGIVPGVLMAVLFFGYIIIRCALNPALAPAYEVESLTMWRRWRPFLVNVVPLLLIFVVVVGSMIAGFATPTEAAALGSLASVAAAAAYRALTFATLRKALGETAKISAMILLIIAASVTFAQILTFSGATDGFLKLMSAWNLSQFELILLMMIVLLVLGCVMDQVSMVMITLPFFLPLAETAGIDKLWLGVLILVNMEIGFTTPPFGLLLFVMKGIAPREITTRQIYRAVTPFILLEIVVLAALCVYQPLATWLPAVLLR